MAWGDVSTRDITINKTGLKWGHTKHMHVNNDMPVGWRYGESFQTLYGQLAQLGASLKCLYTTACSTGNKQEELEVHVHLQEKCGRTAHTNGVLCGWIQALCEGQAKNVRRGSCPVCKRKAGKHKALPGDG